jgi:hypothetical protein
MEKILDARYFAEMKKYLLDGGNGYFNPEWDVNKDGVFDALDYAALKKMLLMS